MVEQPLAPGRLSGTFSRAKVLVPGAVVADEETMRRNGPPLFALVPLDEARQLTGLDAAELEQAPQVQLLMRVFADGRKEPALRVPRELLLDPGPEPEYRRSAGRVGGQRRQ